MKKDRGLTIEWSDGTTSYYSIAYLRKFSPSADARQLRDEMAQNPLTVLPPGFASGGALTATGAEMVGNYAVRITFSDGHSTGIYSWDYLREIDPAAVEARKAAGDAGPGAQATGGDGDVPAFRRERIG